MRRSHHLGYPPGGAKPDDTNNHRNGVSEKTVLADDGPLTIEASARPAMNQFAILYGDRFLAPPL